MVPGEAQVPGSSLERLEYDSLLPLYEDAIASDPDDLDALIWLGHAYTELGRIDEGLEIDLHLCRLRPDDPTIRYNLACSYALLDRFENSLDALEEAVSLGYADAEHLLRDEDLADLRSDPRFLGLVERLRSE